jgi:hypothetical protein
MVIGCVEKLAGGGISVVAAVSAASRFAGDTPAPTKSNQGLFNKAMVIQEIFAFDRALQRVKSRSDTCRRTGRTVLSRY